MLLHTEYSDLMDAWDRWVYFYGSTKLRNITSYVEVFVSAGKDFNEGSLYEGQKVLILITHGREQCKVEECLKNGCCKPCHACNTSKCDKRVKMFVSHEAEDLKKKGVTVMVIGVGNETEPLRLKCFASRDHYIELDSYDRLPFEGFKKAARLLRFPDASLLATTSTTSTTRHHHVAHSTGSAPYSNSSLDSTTHRMATKTTLPIWGYTVVVAVVFILVVIILVVVIVILLKRLNVVRALATGHYNDGVAHRESSNAAPRVDGDTERCTTENPSAEQRRGGKGTFMEFGLCEGRKTLKFGPDARASGVKKTAQVPRHPEAEQYSRTPASITKRYPDGALTEASTVQTSPYDTVKAPNTRPSSATATPYSVIMY